MEPRARLSRGFVDSSISKTLSEKEKNCYNNRATALLIYPNAAIAQGKYEVQALIDLDYDDCAIYTWSDNSAFLVRC